MGVEGPAIGESRNRSECGLSISMLVDEHYRAL